MKDLKVLQLIGVAIPSIAVAFLILWGIIQALSYYDGPIDLSYESRIILMESKMDFEDIIYKAQEEVSDKINDAVEKSLPWIRENLHEQEVPVYLREDGDLYINQHIKIKPFTTQAQIEARLYYLNFFILAFVAAAVSFGLPLVLK